MDARSLVETLAPDRARFVRLARRHVPSPADAEDVVQRAMTRAAERAGSLDDPARARPWFWRILRHAIADFHRSRKSELVSVPAELETAPATCGASGNPCPCGPRLLATLRPAYADVLQRVDVEEQPPKVVASALSISERNLHVRLHRARRALRDRVRAHCGVSHVGPCLDCRCDGVDRCGRLPAGSFRVWQEER